MRFQSASPKLQPPEGFTGAAGSTSNMAHSYGCWQEASVPSHLGLSMGLLEHFHGWLPLE